MRIRVLVLLGAISLPLPLLADTTYTYAGNDFTIADTPYTTSDFISGYFTLSSPLGDNLGEAVISPALFSFTDSVDTITDLTPSVYSEFQVSTDSSGDITSWYIVLNDNADDQINTGKGSIVSDYDYYGENFAANTDDAGTWTDNAPSPTPEPSTLLLLATGLLGLAGAVRHKLLHP